MADLSMDGSQIINGSPGVASTDFVVVSQLSDLSDAILEAIGNGTPVVDRSKSAEILLLGLLARFSFRT